MISLLLTLLALGLVAYFLLRGVGNSGNDRSGGRAVDGLNAQANCERQLSTFVQQTGGVGPAAQSAYDALPPRCKAMMPNPAALAAPPDPDNGN